MRHIALFIIISMIAGPYILAQDSWTMQTEKITSQWAQEVNPDNAWEVYPRPQLQRMDWINLNGLWDYTIQNSTDDVPSDYLGKILVPYPVESALSGVNRRLSQRQKLWYKRNVSIPKKWKNKKILIHFGAVDWEATVYVNGIEVGSHQGGYDPFSFDISHALKPGNEQEIIVEVWDPTSHGTQARGKQIAKPHAIWYTPVSGIWQTVWIEPVETHSIASLRVTPDIDANQIRIQTKYRTVDKSELSTEYRVISNGKTLSQKSSPGNEAILTIENPVLWSPDQPHLYDLEVKLLYRGKEIDKVSSYFAMRKISMGVTDDGHERLFLNNSPLFQYGTLDQGWWPDGLYTAPTPEALKYDIEVTKQSGFNMIRKHVKVEPALWYYFCDQLGMLVWQDMPNGDKGADWRGPSGYDGREMERSAQSAQQFKMEWKEIMDDFYHFPSIVMWVPFNEGWGQFDTMKIINWTMEHDPSRLVNGPSGGNFFPAGHTVDQHQYPGPGMPDPNKHAPEIIEGRVLILGEFGGLGLPIEGHLWQTDKNWGYRNYDDREVLITSYKKLIDQIPELQKKGLAAAIYTQTTDVEGEVNGLMTYDRKVIKMDPEKLKEINSVLYK